jgi:plastocyanin
MIRYSFWLLLLVFLSSCTNAPEEASIKAQEQTSTKEEPVEVKQAAPTEQFVSIMGMKFIPEEIQVHKGDIIIFTNSDIVDHDVTEEKTKAWTSSVIRSGKSWRMVATESCDYFCSIHVVMKGKIIVE